MDLIMAWDIISTPAGPDMSLGAGSESKMTCAHGLIHIWEEKKKLGLTKVQNSDSKCLKRIQARRYAF